MKLPSFRRAPSPAEALAYCERSSATPTSPVHIRVVGDEGRKVSGGAPDTTLCGAPLRLGWDLNGDVAATLDRYAGIPQDQPGRMCLACVAEAREVTGVVRR
jgi:hypothetical protein